MKKTKPFQLIMLIVFIIVAVIAVFVFSQSDKKQNAVGGTYGPVSVWGTVAHPTIGVLFESYSKSIGGAITPNYRYIAPEDFDRVLVEALANGQGPDVLLLPAEWLYRNAPRIFPIPYDPQLGGISQREFQDTFIQSGEVFMYPEGIMALPLIIDPLVMYWNRDLFTNASIATVPTTWDEFLTFTPKATIKEKLNINQSAVGIGEFANVTNAKDIIALLFLQLSNPITQLIPGNSLVSLLEKDRALADALKFYTDFANPLKTIYTWNRSLPISRDLFLSDELAMYFDFASAYSGLQKANPRLNFDIAAVPQTKGRSVAVTFGKVHGLTVLKSAKNLPGGIAFVKSFTGVEYSKAFAELVGLAPARRDLLSIPQSDAFTAVFYDSALKARSWIDPEPTVTRSIFQKMIEAITGGRLEPEEALLEAHSALGAYLESSRR